MISKKSSYNLTIFFLSILCILASVIIYFQEEEISYKESEVKILSVQNIKKDNLKSYYSDVIKDISNEEYVEIRRVIKENEGKKGMSIELAFKGEIGKLHSFLEDMRKKDNFQGINKLEIYSLGENAFIAHVTLYFLV